MYEAYNLSLMGDTSGIVNLIQAVNSNLMFNTFGILTLISIGVVTFMGFLISTGGNAQKSLTASTFICFVISLLLKIMGLIPTLAVVISLVLYAAVLVFVKSYP